MIRFLPLAIVAAAGLDHADELRPWHVCLRTSCTEVMPYDEAFHFLKAGSLLNDSDVEHPQFRKYWRRATADSFGPQTTKS